MIGDAVARGAVLVLFPELGLSAYSCDDLFHQGALLSASRAALGRVVEASRAWPIVAVVGAPLLIEQRLFNCGVVVSRGRIAGVVPKTYLPGYREFYEVRQFSGADASIQDVVDIGGQRDVPFGSRLLFRLDEQPRAVFHVEICEDLWGPLPPSSSAALAGATVMLNLSAPNVTVAKAEYRHQLVGGQSARCLAAYLYTGAGAGESTTDLAWDGHALVYENGTLLAESRRFSREPQLVTAEIDLERLIQDRMRQTTFGRTAERHRAELREFRTVGLALEPPRRGRRLRRGGRCARFPCAPADPLVRQERCAEVHQIQVHGLVKRLEFADIRRVVIGVSGGLDSTHALLVCAQAMDVLGYPRKNIVARTMPGFATSSRTLEQARQLMAVVGCDAAEIDIRPSRLALLRNISHPYGRGEPLERVPVA